MITNILFILAGVCLILALQYAWISADLKDKSDDREYLVCPFNKCCISGKFREKDLCEFAIIDKDGNPDCGYG